MPSQITDLSVFLDEPKEVRLREDGPVYKVPGELLVPVIVKLSHLSKLAEDADGEDQANALVELYEEVLAVFQEHQPELTRLPVGTSQLVAFVGAVYMGQTPDPTPPNGEGSTPSTPPKRTRKSASSS